MVTYHSTNSLILSLVATFITRILLQTAKVDARSWETVVDVSLYSSAILDPYRSAGTTYNPNSTIIDNEWTTPPTESPTSYPISNIIDTVPTAIPTAVPTTVPTTVPSATFSCTSEENSTNAYEAIIRMYDSWGDGWGDTIMIITQPSKPFEVQLNLSNTVFNSFADLFTVTESEDKLETVYEGTLVNGKEENKNLCLQSNVCYTVEVNGTKSEWQNEIQWDIRQKDDFNKTLTTVAKGYAPTKCQFSLPDAIHGTYVCVFSCIGDDKNIHNATSSISPSFSSVPSTIPTITPSDIDSDFPSTVSSITPSYTPSVIPTSPSSGGGVSIVGTPTTGPADKSLRPSLTRTTPSYTPSASPSSVGGVSIAAPTTEPAGKRDRKSTRLNSSHVD